MKKLIVIALAANIGLAHAQVYDWDDPLKPFDATNNKQQTVQVTWRVVDNVQKACEAEYAKWGYKVFNYKADACSVWLDSKCTIITKKRPTMHDLGHEVRHCFQGAWHGK